MPRTTTKRRQTTGKMNWEDEFVVIKALPANGVKTT
jgi:hypothetical protein